MKIMAKCKERSYATSKGKPEREKKRKIKGKEKRKKINEKI